jgi:hypothetical protein
VIEKSGVTSVKLELVVEVEAVFIVAVLNGELIVKVAEADSLLGLPTAVTV